jgi:integrase
VALLVYAGLRPKEVLELRVRDYAPGVEPRVCVGTLRHPRTIRIARAAGATVDAYLASQDTEPDEPLLLGLRDTLLVQRVRAAGREVGAGVGVHDLRRAAVGAALAAGLSVPWVQAYFGMATHPELHDLVPVPEDYDVRVAEALERAFA